MSGIDELSSEEFVVFEFYDSYPNLKRCQLRQTLYRWTSLFLFLFLWLSYFLRLDHQRMVKLCSQFHIAFKNAFVCTS